MFERVSGFRFFGWFAPLPSPLFPISSFFLQRKYFWKGALIAFLMQFLSIRSSLRLPEKRIGQKFQSVILAVTDRVSQKLLLFIILLLVSLSMCFWDLFLCVADLIYRLGFLTFWVAASQIWLQTVQKWDASVFNWRLYMAALVGSPCTMSSGMFLGPCISPTMIIFFLFSGHSISPVFWFSSWLMFLDLQKSTLSKFLAWLFRIYMCDGYEPLYLESMASTLLRCLIGWLICWFGVCCCLRTVVQFYLFSSIPSSCRLKFFSTVLQSGSESKVRGMFFSVFYWVARTGSSTQFSLFFCLFFARLQALDSLKVLLRLSLARAFGFSRFSDFQMSTLVCSHPVS